MTWFKIDDGFATSPKVLSIPRPERLAAIGLWTMAGSWCAAHLTDGFVPAYMVGELGAELSHGTALVEAGLWDEVDAGYRFHDWLDYQPSREDVMGHRERERQRKEAWRAKKAGNTGDGHASVPQGRTDLSHGTKASVPRLSPLPDPTRPDPTRPSIKDSSSQGDGGFAEFYLAYPRKVGKDAAKKAYASALKRADGADIVAGARRLAGDPNLPEKQFVPHPSTWLNRGGWDDEALPPRVSSQGVTSSAADFGQDEWMHRA